MEQKYLTDTNVYIDYLAAKLPVESLNFIDQVYECKLLTSNQSDFSKISGLQIINPLNPGKALA